MIYHIDMTPEQHAWLVAELELMTLNLTENDPPAEEVEALARAVEIAPAFRPATPGEITEAIECHGSDDINIDDNAVATEGEDGTWVSAWIFIGKDDDDDE